MLVKLRGLNQHLKQRIRQHGDTWHVDTKLLESHGVTMNQELQGMFNDNQEWIPVISVKTNHHRWVSPDWNVELTILN